jgi:hypothetical protein
MKPNRKGKFIGGYIKPIFAEYVKNRAKLEHKTITEVLEKVIAESISQDQRDTASERLRKSRREFDR